MTTLPVGNLYIELGKEYRVFSTPGRSSGALCHRCTDQELPGAFFLSDSITAILRWMHTHEGHRHGGRRLTDEARAAIVNTTAPAPRRARP